ncbi:MAG: glycosyltransferase [Planctomycetes bacterium]|nr:glycosyltransferase [Planctomycetota bacterium]
MAPRLLVLSASAGAGHLRAAQAVELALRELAPDAQVENHDVLQLTNAAFRRLYGKAYLELVDHAPHALGWMYDHLDRQHGAPHADRLRYLVQKLNLAPLLALLKRGPWDAFVSTHFLPAEMIAAAKKRRRLAAPQLTVTTDFDTHRLWVNEPCERYFTATADGAAWLAACGVARERITVSGIPIHPLFAQKKGRAGCLERLGLAGDRPIVVQLAGGFGVGPLEEIWRELLALPMGLELVVVAGRNEAAKKKLERIAVPARHRAHVLGFTDQIDELFAVADLLVSKPGGLTTSEALARGVPMAIVNPIPGQESRNSDFLLENGAAIKVHHVATLAGKVGALLADPARLKRLRANAKALGRPQAAYDVARAALELAGASGTGRTAAIGATR